ncbi:YchJ family protein [Rubritalea marina]|uniref:YchJ family protein n=1 Tax=Rubritalea marina TaxID=361055 RepID=UPI00035E47F4|nr:YchJ family metal-binding protein [Rubritalea marina]
MNDETTPAYSSDSEEDRPLRIRLRSDCPCGSKTAYNECCRDFHIGKASPQTAEQLMRSRYSAYFFRLVDYLVFSQHPNTREPKLKQELETMIHNVQWRSLNIHSTSKGGPNDKKGKVEFSAQFHENGELLEMYEYSRFLRHKGVWKYLDGKG